MDRTSHPGYVSAEAMKHACWFLFFALAVAISAPAAVTTVSYYRLGEDDPGAVAGNPANSSTVENA